MRGIRSKAYFGTAQVSSATFNKDESVIVAGGSETKVPFYDVYTGNRLVELVASEKATSSVAVSPDGVHVFTGSVDKLVKMWTANGKQLVALAVGHCGPVTTVKVSPNSSFVVAGGDNGAIYLWNIPKL